MGPTKNTSLNLVITGANTELGQETTRQMVARGQQVTGLAHCHPRSHGCGYNNSSTGIRAIPVIEKGYSKQYKPGVATTKSNEPACRR